MGVLQDFEKRLEGAVEGFFARAFRSGLQPIELAKGIQRYARDNQHVTADGVVVPNVYRVHVGPKDHDRLAGFGASLPRELADVVVRTAAERGWLLRGPVKIRVERNDDVRVGRYRLAGRVEVVDPALAGALYTGGRPEARLAPSAPAVPAPDVPTILDRDAGPVAGVAAAPDDAASPGGASPAGSVGGGASVAAPHPAGSTTDGIDHTQIVSTVPTAALRLAVRSGQNAGQHLPLTASRVTIGRSERCSLSLRDTTVSREHAAFVRRGDAWWVIDLGSTNGTRVNGVRAAELPVSPGDRVELGDVVVELVEA